MSWLNKLFQEDKQRGQIKSQVTSEDEQIAELLLHPLKRELRSLGYVCPSESGMKFISTLTGPTEVFGPAVVLRDRVEGWEDFFGKECVHVGLSVKGIFLLGIEFPEMRRKDKGFRFVFRLDDQNQRTWLTAMLKLGSVLILNEEFSQESKFLRFSLTDGETLSRLRAGLLEYE